MWLEWLGVYEDVGPAELAAGLASGGEVVDALGTRTHLLRLPGRDRAATPTVLLHGNGCSIDSWSTVPADLAGQGDGDVLVLDLPGNGLTGAPPGNDFSTPAMAKYVMAVLAAAGVPESQPVVLCGHSWGGAIAIYAASMYPERVSRLVLIASDGYEGEGTDAVSRLAAVPVLYRLLHVLTPKSFVRSMLHEGYSDPSRVTDEQVERYHLNSRGRGHRQAMTSLLRLEEDHTDHIKRVACPTLLLWGIHDRFLSFTDAAQFLTDVESCAAIVYYDCGHFIPEEQPARCALDILAFLRGRIAPGSAVIVNPTTGRAVTDVAEAVSEAQRLKDEQSSCCVS